MTLFKSIYSIDNEAGSKVFLTRFLVVISYSLFLLFYYFGQHLYYCLYLMFNSSLIFMVH